MDFSISDLLFLIVVLWIATEIINNGGWGGGRRIRPTQLVPSRAGCPV